MIMILRRNSVVMLGLALLLGVMAVFVGGRADSLPANTLSVYGRTVVVDAGHGNPDGGCMASDGTKEATLNLSIAQKLANILLQSGCKVVMTRTTDEGLYNPTDRTIREKKRSDMYKRRDIQQNSRADIFVSIHMNHFGQSKYRGAQVVYDTKNPQAKVLAKHIQASLRENVDPNNYREALAARPEIYILKDAPIPSVIVECGFLSNQQELALLKTEDYQSKLAWAIYCGIANYFEQAADEFA